MAEVLAVYADVAVGLETVHSAGMAHGDIKPDNVILDHDGVPTLVDFGFAALLHDRGTGIQRAEVMGTVPYMAPEVRRGDVRLASDVHAYGVSLWEALTDALPFEEEYAPAGLFGSASLPHEALVPHGLRRILKSAMQRGPRAPSIQAVRTAVQRAAVSQRRAHVWSPIASRVVPLVSLIAVVAIAGVTVPKWLEAAPNPEVDPGAHAESAFRQLQEVWSSGTEAQYLDGYEETLACFYDRDHAPRNSVRLGIRGEHFARTDRPPAAPRLIAREVVSPTQVVLHEERVRDDGTRTQGFRTVEMHFSDGRWRVRQEVSSSKRRCWTNPVPE
ncbi:MAG: protein kinase [Sandaracinaceae bacterium]|nr:protein kinase [Sandaracinaceae bacterium]